MRRIGLAVVLAVGLVLAAFAAEGQTGGKVFASAISRPTWPLPPAQQRPSVEDCVTWVT
jgi:hypothetical protein